MTGRIEKTVFISYRRTNLPWALAIYQHLTSQGYDVFFDYLSINSGDFEKIIVENIRGRAHFIVILTPSALERCQEPGDWLRREIKTAMDEKRNIVPLMLESFDFGGPATVKALTGKLENLKKYNGLRVPSEYFFEAMNRLREQFLNVALDSVVHPISESAKQITKEHQVAANDSKQVGQEQLSAQEWFERGYVFQEAYNLDEAIRCFTVAIRLKPDFIEPYMHRAWARSVKGDLEGAIEDDDEVIRLNTEAIRLKPEDDNAYNNRGIALTARGDFDGAIADFDEAIRLNPDSAGAYYDRGAARQAKGELESALADYDEAIRLEPDLHNAYINRAGVRNLKGDFDGAIADSEEAIRVKPNSFAAYSSRANSLVGKHDLDGAIANLNKAIRLNPDAGMVRLSLISILRKSGRKAQADEQEKLARELIAKENEYNLACFEAICSNTDKALELLKIALGKNQVSKQLARQDRDFESIRDDPRFKELIGE